MTVKKNVNEMLGMIFSDPRYIEIICSLHERELSIPEITAKTGDGTENISQYLDNLVETNIVRTRVYDGEDKFTITDTKICESVLMLKDSLYRVKSTLKH